MEQKEWTISAAACSDKGCRRDNNEDNFCLNGLYMQRSERDEGGLYEADCGATSLFAVCDGMGGEAAGEEASFLSVQLCANYMKNSQASTESKKLRDFLLDGTVSVFKQAERNENHSGSTLAMLLANPSGLRVANMGDSRVYRMTGDRFEQISYDHSEVQRLMDVGRITAEEARTHPKRHMILQYWGMPLSVARFDPYIGELLPWRNGDRYLLCSDGLTDMLEDDEIRSILGEKKLTAGQISRALVDKALENGGRDNVTVLTLCLDGPEEDAEEKTVERLSGQSEKKPSLLAKLFGHFGK